MDVRVANPGAVADTNREDLVGSDGSIQRRSQSPGSNTAERRCWGESAIADDSAHVWPESERNRAVDAGGRPFLPAERVINVSGRLAARLPFGLIGLLLATTAIAKLWMLLTDSFADIRVGIPREILWLSAAFEIWLAYENFRLRDHRVVAWINAVVFAIFGLFSVSRMVLGYGSCGCSVNIEIPAWVFVAIDFGIVGYFLSSVRRRSALSQGWMVLQEMWQGWSPDKRGRMIGLALFVAMILAIQLPIARPLRAWLWGELPIQSIVRLDSELVVDHEGPGHVEVWNRSSQPARIIGLQQSCRCFVVNDLKTIRRIPAGKRISLPLQLTPEKTGPLHQRVILYLDHPEQLQVNVDVLGYVRE